MDWSAVWTELPKAIGPFVGTVVGGLLAIVGGVIGGFAGQYFTHRYTRTREAEKLIREKGEELVQALFTYRDWLQAFRVAVLLSKTTLERSSPLDRAHTIQRFHFPELQKHFEALDEAGSRYIQAIIEEWVVQTGNSELKHTPLTARNGET